MHLNFVVIVIATIIQFILGSVWYSFLFGKLWRRIHGFDKLSKEVQQQMMKTMGPFYGVQALMTLITTVILALFIAYLPHWNAFAMAGFFWIGFIIPAQVSAVIFGGTKKKWIVKKIAVQAGGALVCLVAAAALLHFFA